MEKPALTIDDFLKAENLAALRKAYADRGQTFWRFSAFYNKALDDWFELHRQSIIDAPNGMPKELPAIKVEKDGVAYYVHGLAHTRQIDEAIRWQFRGKAVIRESNVANRMPTIAYKFSDHAAFPLEICVFDLLSASAFIVPFFGLAAAYAIARRRAPIRELALCNRIVAESVLLEKYPSDIMKFRAFTKAIRLPLKLDIEHYEKHATAFTHNLFYGRSKYMAEFMRQFAHRKNLNELHAIVGAAHEPQIAYCLENGITSPRIQKLARHYLEKELKSKGEI